MEVLIIFLLFTCCFLYGYLRFQSSKLHRLDNYVDVLADKLGELERRVN